MSLEAFVLLFAISLFANALSNLVVAYRYNAIISRIGERLGFLKAVRINAVSQVSAYLLPIKLAGLTVRPVMTKLVSGISLRKSAVASTYEQFFDTFWQVLSIPLLLIMIGGGMEAFLGPAALVLVAMAATALLIIKYPKKAFNLVWGMRRIIPKRARKKLSGGKADKEEVGAFFEESLRLAYDRKMILMMVPLTVAIILVSPVYLYFTVLMFAPGISITAAFVVYWLSQIAGRLSGIPGGFGSKDLTIVGLLGIYGVALGPAVSIALMLRVTSILPSLVIGGWSAPAVIKEIRKK
jgi:uncharacterized protein (TIRG00374 family)